MFPDEEDIKVIGNIIGNNRLDFSDLKPIASSGLTHEHIIIDNSDYILRVPRKNQLNMNPEDYLYHQKFCYQVASESGVTPYCQGILRPSEDMPNGALIIERIDGRKVDSADDLKAVAKCLAQMSKVQPVGGGILDVVKTPFDTILKVNDFFFDTYLNSGAIDAPIKNKIADMRASVDSEIANLSKDFPIGMIGGDSHLGNYLIDKQGKAWFVDLEFLAFDVPTLDCADAVLNVTKQLVPENKGFTISAADKNDFYSTYFANINNVNEVKPYVDVAEKLVTLRTIGWMCYWQSEGKYDANKPEDRICAHYNEVCADNLRLSALNDLFAKPVIVNDNNIRGNFKFSKGI